MFTDKLQELAAAKAKIAELEKAVASELSTELRALPQKYGFDTTVAFISAVRAASGKRRGRPPANAAAAVPRKRTRAKITDATRAEVKKLVEAGKKAPEIAKAVGISEPSVANIKKALGLTKKRK